MDIKYIGGIDPVMVLLDQEYNEVEVSMGSMFRKCLWGPEGMEVLIG